MALRFTAEGTGLRVVVDGVAGHKRVVVAFRASTLGVFPPLPDLLRAGGREKVTVSSGEGAPVDMMVVDAEPAQAGYRLALADGTTITMGANDGDAGGEGGDAGGEGGDAGGEGGDAGGEGGDAGDEGGDEGGKGGRGGKGGGFWNKWGNVLLGLGLIIAGALLKNGQLIGAGVVLLGVRGEKKDDEEGSGKVKMEDLKTASGDLL